MIGLVIAAHGSLPLALNESTQMILGDLEQSALVTLMPGDSLEGLIERLKAEVERVNTGDGVLILLDLFGGTPANAAAFLTQTMDKVRAVTGVNFPMIAEVFIARQSTDDVDELAGTAFTAGQAGIVNVVESFKKFRTNP